MMPIKSLLFSAGLLISGAACSDTSTPVNDAAEKAAISTIENRPTSLTRLDIPNAPEGSISERGVITVPVNRSKPEGQTIDVEFFRFQRIADANPDTPPIVLLRGGPGYPGLGNAIENEAFYAGSIARYTQLSDFIIIGQRGFGTSGDLSCDSVPPSPFEEVSTSAKSRDRYRRTAELCRDKYLSLGHDLSGYNIKEMASDVAEVSKALGYETIQLKGTSFGSFWSLAVMRQYPDLVTRATLSALEGPDHTFDRPSAVKATFETLAEAAAKSERYAERIPAEGLIAAYQAVIDRADAAPFQTSFVDQESGETITVNIDGDALRRFSYGVSSRPIYRYTMHDWPEDLLKIIEGNMSEVAPLLYRYMRGTDVDSAAEEIIECSSGISAQRREDIDNDPAQRFVDPPILFDPSMCDLWGEAIVEMDHSDFVTDVPTVLIQGTWDISTPYKDAQSVTNLFTDHHFVIVEGGSHGAIFEAEEQSPGFTQSLYDWYASGDLSNMPETVTLQAFSWKGDE